jgi:hypothetical protein
MYRRNVNNWSKIRMFGLVWIITKKEVWGTLMLIGGMRDKSQKGNVYRRAWGNNTVFLHGQVHVPHACLLGKVSPQYNNYSHLCALRLASTDWKVALPSFEFQKADQHVSVACKLFVRPFIRQWICDVSTHFTGSLIIWISYYNFYLCCQCPDKYHSKLNECCFRPPFVNNS